MAATLTPDDVQNLRDLITRTGQIETRVEELATATTAIRDSAGALIERLGNAEAALPRVTAALETHQAELRNQNERHSKLLVLLQRASCRKSATGRCKWRPSLGPREV